MSIKKLSQIILDDPISTNVEFSMDEKNIATHQVKKMTNLKD